MPDREKVIKGLETIRYNLRQMNHGLLADFCDDALELLKQEETNYSVVFDVAYKAGKESVVQCKDCKKHGTYDCHITSLTSQTSPDDWFCADGEKKCD